MLIAPLDWGLGHAARMIPIVKFLQQNGCRVVLTASGISATLLQKTFPGTEFIQSEQFKIRYSRSGNWMPFVLLAQLPRIALSIVREHFWLKKVCKEIPFDLILSDNRPGLFHRSIKSVYITHQLAIQGGNGLANRLLRGMHYFFINRFSACWVPDYPEPRSLAGKLSNPEKLPRVPTTYIGCLSRFEKPAGLSARSLDLLILLSGPEPQRTVLEERIISQIKDAGMHTCLVRGVDTGTPMPEYLPEHLEVHDFLPTEQLNEKLESARMVLCRSGYSSVMDLIKLKKKAILIPTPGQTEQEYLAQHLRKKGYFYTAAQETFNLNEALKEAVHFGNEPPDFSMHEFEEVLKRMIQA